jgi:hypothetical protein
VLVKILNKLEDPAMDGNQTFHQPMNTFARIIGSVVEPKSTEAFRTDFEHPELDDVRRVEIPEGSSGFVF